MKKRILSFLLALLMFFGMLPLNVIAEGSEDYSSNVTGTAVFNPEWNTVSDEETVYGVAYVTNDPTLGLNMSTDYTMSLEGVMDQTFYINDYYSDGTGYWYELAALSGETLPGKLSAMPWVYQNDIPSGAYPDYLIVTPPVVEPTDPTDPVEPTDPTEPEDSCDCCENCTGAEDCQCLCGACDFCQPEVEPELPVLTHPTGVEVTAESFPEGVTLTVQDVSVSSQLKKYEIPESKLVFGLDISLVNADSSIYQPDGALVKVPVSAPAGTSIGIIHDHDGDISFMGVTEVLSDGTVEFYTDSFSTFAGFTVDFHYNGVDFSIEGLTSILLSDLFAAMGIEEDAYAAESVVFSDNNLVTTTRQDNGDWLLTSLQAFQTEETLMITFTDGRTIIIDVTDALYETEFEFNNSDVEGHMSAGRSGSQTFYVYLYNGDAENYFDSDSVSKIPVEAWLDLTSNTYWFELKKVEEGGAKLASNPYSGWTDMANKQNAHSIAFALKPFGSGAIKVHVKCWPRAISNNSKYCKVYQAQKFADNGDVELRNVEIYVTRNGQTTREEVYSNIRFPDRNGDENDHGTPDAGRDITLPTATTGYKYVSKSLYNNNTYRIYVERINYTIKFDSNGGSAVSNLTYNIEEPFTLPTPSRPGYDFQGWKVTTADGNWSTSSTNLKGTIAAGKHGDVTLTAQWKEKSYTVNFDYNGGYASDEPTKISASHTVTTASGNYNDVNWLNPIKDGYNFTGWYTTSGTQVYGANGKCITGDYWNSDSTWKGTADLSLQAGWKEITYSISYHGNGATGGSMSNQSFTFGAAQNLSENQFERKHTVSYTTNNGTTISPNTVEATFKGWEDHGTIIYQGTTYGYPSFDVPYYANSSKSAAWPNGDIWGNFGYSKLRIMQHYVDHGLKEGRKIKGDTPWVYPDKAEVNNMASRQGDVVPLYASWELGEVTLPTLPDKEGYTFGGWSYGGKIYAGGSVFTPEENVTLTAVWNAKTYKVTLDAQNGAGESDGTTAYWYIYNTTKNVNGETVYYWTDAACTQPLSGYTITKPVKKGHTFGGYYEELNGGGFQYVNANGMCINNLYAAVADNSTLYAKWNAKTFTVNYHSNGGSGSMDSHTVVYGNTIQIKNNTFTAPTGKRFAGWAVSATGTAGEYEWSKEDKTGWSGTWSYDNGQYGIANDTLNLYAIWEADVRTVTWKNWNGAELEKDTVTYNGTATYNGTVPTRESAAGYSYSFTGWDKGSNGMVSNVTTDTTVTAQYSKTPINYTASFNYNGGDAGDPTKNFTVESALDLPKLTKTGYTGKWIVTKIEGNWTNGAEFASESTVAAGKYGNVTFTAQWTPITYKIQFAGGEGATGSMTETTATYDKDVTLPENKFQRIIKVTYDVNGGKNLDPDDAVVSLEAKFANWLYGSKTYADQATVKNLASTQDAVVQMTAQWNLKSTAMPTAERDGYTFEGWMEEGVATGSNIFAGSSYTPTRDTTLVAQWKAVDYTITYDSNGGSNVAPTAYNAEQAVTLAEAPTREGYKFDGWKLKNKLLESEGNWDDTIYTAGQVIGTGKYGNITLVAQWKEQCRYVLKFDANGGENAPAQIIQDWTDNTEHIFTWTQVPTRAGYTFLGWAEAATSEINVAGSSYNTYTVSGKETETVEKALFAIWKRDTGALFLDYSGDGTPVIVTVTCTQAAEASELITIQTVINDDTTIVNLPTGEYSVTVESGTASYAASVKTNPNPQIVKNETAVVEISIGSKGLNWFTAFYWVKNQFGKQS